MRGCDGVVGVGGALGTAEDVLVPYVVVSSCSGGERGGGWVTMR